jgi:hypothetical protein
MASAKITRDLISADDLPQICAQCGAPATVAKLRTFTWSPSWIFVFLFIGLLPFVILAVILTKRVRFAVPLCDAHENHWRWRAQVTWGSLLGVLLLLGVAAASLDMVDKTRGPGSELTGFLCVAGPALGLIWLIAAAIVQSRAIQASLIDDYAVTLTRVSRDFTEAVDARAELRAAKIRES